MTQVDIGLMRDAEAAVVARLHVTTISGGFLRRLGLRFMRQLYLGIAHDPDSRVFVARDDSGVIGFCAYTGNVAGLYRRVLGARFVALAWAALPRALSPAVIGEVLDTLRYPSKQSAAHLPPAEILSIGVDARVRVGGVGRGLLEAALTHARQSGVAQVKVLAGARLAAANAFYSRCGFHQVSTLMQHGEPLNVYVRELS